MNDSGARCAKVAEKANQRLLVWSTRSWQTHYGGDVWHFCAKNASNMAIATTAQTDLQRNYSAIQYQLLARSPCCGVSGCTRVAGWYGCDMPSGDGMDGCGAMTRTMIRSHSVWLDGFGCLGIDLANA